MAFFQHHSSFKSAQNRLFIFVEYTLEKMKKNNHCNSRALLLDGKAPTKND